MNPVPLDGVLDRLAPAGGFVPDWDDVCARAQRGKAGRRMGRALVALVAAGVALIALAALAAAQRDWWLGGFGDGPVPIGEPVVVMSGVVNGEPWEYVAYRSRPHEGRPEGFCWGVGLVGLGGSLGGRVCGSVPRLGERVPGYEHAPTISTGSSSGIGPDPAFVYGHVVSEAVRVEVTLDDGRVVAAPAVDAPDLDVGFRFYAAPLPPAGIIRTVKAVGFDADGDVVACFLRGRHEPLPLSACAEPAPAQSAGGS